MYHPTHHIVRRFMAHGGHVADDMRMVWWWRNVHRGGVAGVRDDGDAGGAAIWRDARGGCST